MEEMKKVAVVLTLLSNEDWDVRARSNSEEMRRHRIVRLASESKAQGGLLTQEDLAYLNCCDVRTIRRDINALKKRNRHVPTRGQQKDIGPSMTHREQAVTWWLKGNFPEDVADMIQHTVANVKRYIKAFCRIVVMLEKGYTIQQIGAAVNLSRAAVTLYRNLYAQERTGNGLLQNRRLDIERLGTEIANESNTDDNGEPRLERH